MSCPIQLKTHPFRLLLYLEWILLGITVLTEYHPGIIPPHPHAPFHHVEHAPFHHIELPTILSIAAFGMLGLQLPTGKLLPKVLYTGLCFALILLAVVTGGRDIRFFPWLFLIVVLRSCLLFGLSGRLSVAGLTFGSFVLELFFQARKISDVDVLTPRVVPPRIPLMPPLSLARGLTSEDQARFVLHLILNVALLFGLVLVFVLLLTNALLAERQSRQKLALANEQLRQYAQMIEDQATLQERNRIAREIHDSLGHSLTAQSIQLENALMFWQSNADKAQAFLIEAKQLGSDALREVRQSIGTLRSNPLQGQSLELAILSLVRDFHRTTGIMPDCTLSLSLQLSSKEDTAIYRIVKEALNNIYKHGAATQVTIHLQATAQTLSLLVEDNGRGFNLAQNTTGFGIQGMRERAVGLGGKFNIASQPGAGCQIVVYLPLARLSP